MTINLRRISSRISRTKASSRAKSSKRPILDENLTYSADSDTTWSFEEEDVLYNGNDVKEMINENFDDSSNLISLSSGLTEYRNFIHANGALSKPMFNEKVESLQGTLASFISNIYIERTYGIRIQYVEGKLWLNGIDVQTIIDLYKTRPDKKMRAYLLSWRQKLILLLERNTTSCKSNGWWNEAKQLFDKIETVLRTQTDSNRLLSAPSGN